MQPGRSGQLRSGRREGGGADHVRPATEAIGEPVRSRPRGRSTSLAVEDGHHRCLQTPGRDELGSDVRPVTGRCQRTVHPVASGPACRRTTPARRSSTVATPVNSWRTCSSTCSGPSTRAVCPGRARPGATTAAASRERGRPSGHRAARPRPARTSGEVSVPPDARRRATRRRRRARPPRPARATSRSKSESPKRRPARQRAVDRPAGSSGGGVAGAVVHDAEPLPSRMRATSATMSAVVRPVGGRAPSIVDAHGTVTLWLGSKRAGPSCGRAAGSPRRRR